jgi:chromosome segregation ATPase
MKKELFEVLLENIDSKVSLMAESLEGVHGRLDQADGERRQLLESHERVDLRLRALETGQAKLEQGQTNLQQGMSEVRDELRGVRHTVGLLHTIATSHESRLQTVENNLRDHIDRHG